MLIPRMLQLFRDHGIQATWATVGFLFARNKEELLDVLPLERPRYHQHQLDPYPILLSDQTGNNETEDPYHYAPSLIEAILKVPGQELGSHTLSHYYCLEDGQSAAAFASDLRAAQQLARKNFGLHLRSLVFPRNQSSPASLPIVRQQGFQAVRTNPGVWFWQHQDARSAGSLVQKAMRLADHYLPIDQDTTFKPGSASSGLCEVPASRFFRPYLSKLDGWGGQALKVGRICREMTLAAQNGSYYHLWWHPHNMATNPGKNFAALEHILHHYRDLNRRYGMESSSMLAACNVVDL